MEYTITNLIWAATVIGSLIGGFLGAKKIPIVKNNKNSFAGYKLIPENKLVEKSEKTSGAKHISEEGLQKHTELRKELKDDYLPEQRFDDKCAKNRSDMMLHISEDLDKRFGKMAEQTSQQMERHTTVILEALKGQ